MSKLNSIITGWSRYIWKDQNAEQRAKAKAEICAKCDQSKLSLYSSLLKDNSLKKVKGMICDVCKCPLSTKLRSDDPCPHPEGSKF